MKKIFLVIITVLVLLIPISVSQAKEPKTFDEALKLLIEQQIHWFPQYTCEFEVSREVVPNGRGAITQETFPKKMKMLAAKNKSDYTLKIVENNISLESRVPVIYDYALESNGRLMTVNPYLGPNGYVQVRGFADPKTRSPLLQTITQPDRLFEGFAADGHWDIKYHQLWIEQKYGVGTLEKVQLDWPPVPEVLRLRIVTDSYDMDVFMDPSQGYLPVKTITRLKRGQDQYGPLDSANPRITTTVLLESKEFSRGRFFPMRVMTLRPETRAPDESGECRILYHKVTKLEVDKEPTPEDMSIPISAGCMVGTDLDEGPHITLRQDEKLKPSHISQLVSMLEKEQESRKKRGERAIQDTALIDPPPSRGWSSYLWWAVGGLALLSLLLYLLRRFSRKSS